MNTDRLTRASAAPYELPPLSDYVVEEIITEVAQPTYADQLRGEGCDTLADLLDEFDF